MVASNFSPSMLKLDATGGSTGHTLSFYHDRNSLDHISAITIRGDRWAGLDIGTPNARLWGAPNELKAQGRFVNRLTNRALNRLFLDCFHLSDELLADYVEKLRRYRPKVLVGYATALATMAEFIEAHNIQDLRLQSIISSAETLFDEQRQQIESAFGCKVYNRYGCREAGPLIVECEEGRMHVSADYVHLELLRNGQPVPPGEVGEIVITPLFNYGMPLIRYQIGDMGIAASQVPCACGRGLPLIERVLGRTSDMLVNTRGEFFHGEYFSHLFYHQPGVRQFQVVQPDPQHLIFRTVTDQNFDTNLFEKLEETILDFVGPMEIEWRIVDEIPPLKSGKRSFTVSMVPVDFATSNVGTD
jgi:phenylacetate-CoA ligase